jgi:hypothetical protein
VTRVARALALAGTTVVGIACGVCADSPRAAEAASAPRAEFESPVVAFQRSGRWTGLNSLGDLIDVRIAADALSVTGCRRRGATEAEVAEIARAVAAVLDEVTAENAALPDETLRTEGPGFGRCNLWLGRRAGEYDFPSLRAAHPLLKKLADLVDAKLRGAKETSLAAILVAEPLDRKFGPEQQTYAEVYRRKGQAFAALDRGRILAEAPAVGGALDFAGSLVVLDEPALLWLQRVEGWKPEGAFVALDGKSFQLRAWTRYAPARGPEPGAHPNQRRIIGPPDGE